MNVFKTTLNKIVGWLMQSQKVRDRLLGVLEEQKLSRDDIITQQQKMLYEALQDQGLNIRYFHEVNCANNKAIVLSELFKQQYEGENLYQLYGSIFPLSHREDIRPFVEQYIQDAKKANAKSVLTRNEITHIAQTSGTADKVKYIPISRERVENDKAVMGQIIQQYLSKYPDSKIFYGKTLTMGSALNGNVGYISSILARHAGWLVNTFIRLPSQKTAGITDRPTKMAHIAQEVIQGGPVTVMAGVMVWGNIFLEYFLETYGRDMFLKYFGKCELFILGGAPVGDMIQKIESLFQKILGEKYNPKARKYISTYNASEGFMGFGDVMTGADAMNPDESMRLITNHGLIYQFIEKEKYHHLTDAKKERVVYPTEFPTIGLDKVELGKEYIVLLTHPSSGLRNYCIGDAMAFTCIDDQGFRFKLVGRTTASCNIVNEHTEEIHITNTINTLGKSNICLEKYLVRPRQFEDGSICYEWLVESNEESLDLHQIASLVHQSLQEENPNYKRMSTNGARVIHDSVVYQLPVGAIQRYELYGREVHSQTKKLPILAGDTEITPSMLEYFSQHNVVFRMSDPHVRVITDSLMTTT